MMQFVVMKTVLVKNRSKFYMNSMQNTSSNLMSQPLFIICYAIIGIASRLLPHPAGMTAFTSFCLLSGLKCENRFMIIGILIAAIISDWLLSLTLGYSSIGLWMVFTYSGYLGLFLLGRRFRTTRLLTLLCSGSMAYWLWTNFGMWLFSGVYQHTVQGFVTCYTLALPFLRNGLMGDVMWGFLMVVTLRLFENIWRRGKVMNIITNDRSYHR